MKVTRIIATAVLTVGLTAAPALADEEGATFDGGICWEADGTEGLTRYDGECVTPADYDEIFSFENLSNEPSTVFDGRSVAEVYGLTPNVRASERPRLFEGDVEPTFAETVRILHSGNIAL